MTTTLEADELNTEIQELYLENKQRVSDLEFLAIELKFIITRLESKATPLIRFNNFNKLAALLAESAETGATQLRMKSDLAKYSKKLESLINDSSHQYGIDLIEINSTLEREYGDYWKGFQSFKNRSFDLTKHMLKKDGLASISVKTGNGYMLGLRSNGYHQYRPFYGPLFYDSSKE
jgi:hypothetical protein